MGNWGSGRSYGGLRRRQIPNARIPQSALLQGEVRECPQRVHCGHVDLCWLLTVTTSRTSLFYYSGLELQYGWHELEMMTTFIWFQIIWTKTDTQGNLLFRLKVSQQSLLTPVLSTCQLLPIHLQWSIPYEEDNKINLELWYWKSLPNWKVCSCVVVGNSPNNEAINL